MLFNSAQGLRCFQNLLDRIAGDPELTPPDRQRRASAIRSFLRHTGGDATAPCDRQAVRTRLERGPCGHKPISDKTWSNLCTEMRWVMDRYDAPSLQGKNRFMSPAWGSLWAEVKDDRSYIPMSRLVHWASNNALEPEDIDDDALGGAIWVT